MKHRLRRYLLVILLGVPLLIFLSLSLVYIQQRGEGQDLEAQVLVARQLLRRPAPDLKDLEPRLAQAEQEVEELRQVYPGEDGGDALVEILLEKARNCGLKVLAVSAQGPITQKEGNKGSTAMPITLQVAGDTSSYLAFLSYLDLPTLQLKGARLTEDSDIFNITLDLLVLTSPQE